MSSTAGGQGHSLSWLVWWGVAESPGWAVTQRGGECSLALWVKKYEDMLCTLERKVKLTVRSILRRPSLWAPSRGSRMHWSSCPTWFRVIAHLSTCPPIHIHSSTRPPINLPIQQSTHPPIYHPLPSVHPSTHQPLHFHPSSIRPSTQRSIHPSIVNGPPHPMGLQRFLHPCPCSQRAGLIVTCLFHLASHSF